MSQEGFHGMARHASLVLCNYLKAQNHVGQKTSVSLLSHSDVKLAFEPAASQP